MTRTPSVRALPSDAQKTSTVKWFRNSTLRYFIGSIQTRHTLLIADACFSGAIFKTRSAGIEDESAATQGIQKLYELPSRKAMTSGILQEVPDESKFIKYLVKRLEESKTKFNAKDLQNAFSFLERIEKSTKNRMDYLEVQKSRQHSASENEMLKDGFNKRSKETQTLLSLYHILKNQFDTSRSFFGEVLPTRFLKDYSKFLKEMWR